LRIALKNISQLAKIHNSSLNDSHSDDHLTFSDHITSLSKANYYHIRQHRCIQPYFDLSTACTIATSIVHFKLDSYNTTGECVSVYCVLAQY